MAKTQKKNLNTTKRFDPLIGQQLKSLFLGFLESYYPDRLAVYSKKFSEGVSVINNQSAQRGKRETLAYNKLCRLAVTRYLSGEPLPKSTPKVKLNNEGLPIILQPFHTQLRDGRIEDLKIIFTMLNLTRGVILEPINDFKSITDTYKGNLPITWDTFKLAIKKILNIKRKRYVFGGVHTSTKSGPNGQAMLFATKDYLALPETLKASLVSLGGPKFAKIFSELDKTGDGVSTLNRGENTIKLREIPKEDLKVRKLSTFGDKEGKTRVIGILDYGSQAVLYPIHKALEECLRGISEDCTFDQSSGYSKLPTDCVYYSFDLTTATDRLPVIHQKEIIAIIFGKKIADAWHDIMVHYSFTYKKTSINYGAGQPMGAYSSGPIMAIQHHFIVVHAAILAGKSAKGKYVLLGDDIVIADKDIADKYQQILRDLDVPISQTKTHISKHMCEFAKRGYYKGHEITGFPLHSIRNNLKRYYLLQNTLEDSRKKGYLISDELERGRVIELIAIGGKKRQAVRLYKLYKLFDAITTYKQNKGDGEELYGSVAKAILANGKVPPENFDKYFLDPKVFEEQVNFQMEEFFLDLTSEGNQEMMEMMDLRKSWMKVFKPTPDLGDSVRSSIPIVQSFDSCGERRTKILDTYYKEFANEKSKLRASLVLLANLPAVSTRIVNTRSAHVILASQSRLVKQLLNAFVKVKIPESEMTEEDGISQMKTIQSGDGEGLG